MLGASDVLLADCVTYLRWQLGFAPALMLQILFQMYFVTEGRPGIGLFLTVAAGITNAVLDYILIVPMGMGIAGAAIATVTGYMIPALFGLIYFASAKRSLWFVRPRMSGAELGETCLNGSSEMVTNLSAGIITFLFNLTMMRFAGEDGVAAITIIQYSEFLLNALFMGFSQGISPVVSFNHGSRNHAQLKQVYKTAMIFTVAASVTVFLFAQFAGDAVVTVFARRGHYGLAAGQPRILSLCHGLFVLRAEHLFLRPVYGAGKWKSLRRHLLCADLRADHHQPFDSPRPAGRGRRVAGDPHRGAGQHLAVAVLPEAVHTGVSVRVNILRLILVLNEL